MVRILQVPVIQHHHQDFQTLQLICPFERIVIPVPFLIVTFQILRPSFEAHIFYSSLSFNFRFRHEVIDVREIAGGPN